MAGYSNNTPKQIYENGIFAKFTQEELDFIKSYQNDNFANQPPSPLNILGRDDGTNPSSDKPFRYILPNINDGRIDGFGWRNPLLPGTTGPGDSSKPNRAAISTDTTKDAISKVKSGEITSKEAMFIIRARVGAETADIPKNIKPGSTDRELYALQNPNAHYGSGNNNTSFNNMKDQISNQDKARQLLSAFNNWTYRVQTDKNIKETYQQNGTPIYIEIHPDAKMPEDRITVFTPDVESIMSSMGEKERQSVLKDLDHLVSAKETRNPNDDTIRKTGPKLKIFDFVENVGGDVKTIGGKIYKDVKSVVKDGFYPAMICVFIVCWFLTEFGVLSGHTTHHLFQAIEAASTGVKTLKNVSRQGDPNYRSWTDYLSPIYSIFAPFGWLQIGKFFTKLLEGKAATARLSIYAGPMITVIAISMELGYEWWKYKKKAKEERDKLYRESIQNGYLPGPYINSGGLIKIPAIPISEKDPSGRYDVFRNKYRVPIGIKRDKDGNPIHLKYKDIDPNAPIPELDVPMLDRNGRPIPGSWLAVPIYGTEPIAMNGGMETGDISEPGIHGDLAFYTDTDENILLTNIATNQQILDNQNRSNRFAQISDINNSNGFSGNMSDRDEFPYTPPPEQPERGGQAGDEPDFRSPLERLTDANPWGDGNDYELVSGLTIENTIETIQNTNPTENKNGQPTIYIYTIPNGNAGAVAGYLPEPG